MTPRIPNIRTQTIAWRNEHGTFRRNNVTRVLPIAATGPALDHWRRVGEILKGIVTYAFRHNEPLRVDGSRWSLSKIGVPDKLALSLAAHDVMHEVPASWWSAAYGEQLTTSGLTPMLVSGAMKIGRFNRFLAMRDLALQTSGASDGQSLAGATATGTHGGAISLGALHDTVRAVHLMVSPTKTVLVQPSSAPLRRSAATTLENWLGLATELISDDAIFEAALVHLGSLGIVLNMVVETQPLYYLASLITPQRGEAYRRVVAQAATGQIAGHPADPFHVEVVISPYPARPRDAPRAWAKTMTKHDYTDQGDVATDPSHSPGPSPDLIGLLAAVGDLVDLPVAFRRQITKQLVDRYGTRAKRRHALPGSMFGPTSLPRGRGHSVEYMVAGDDASAAVDVLLDTLRREARRGRQFLGAMGVRFVGASRATLAPNRFAPTCCIELPGIRTRESTKIYDACAAALASAGVVFGSHWGQYLSRTKHSLRTYWGMEARDAWLAARQRLLQTDGAHRVFASPILGPAGLG